MKVRKAVWIARDKLPYADTQLFLSEPRLNKLGEYLCKNGALVFRCTPHIGLRPGQCAKFVLEVVK